MDLPPVLSILVGMVIILMGCSIVNRSPNQNLGSALAEGVLWSVGFFVAFSVAIFVSGRFS